MVVGILQVELMIGGADSLKDKRSVVKSLKDKLHRDYMVSVAEIDAHDKWRTAVLGLAAVSTSVPHVQGLLDRIVDRLSDDRRFVLSDKRTEILTGH